MFSEILFESISTWALLVEIVLAGAIVIFSGARVTLLADEIADRYNLGGAWVGMLLLATVTSLPEVVASCTSVAIGRSSMAFGAVFGSCSFNIVLIVLLNFFVGGGSILSEKPRVHSLSSSCGIVLIVLAVASILVVDGFRDRPSAARQVELGAALLIAITYCFCMYMVFQTEREITASHEPAVAAEGKAPTPYLGFRVALFSVILVGAAWWLARTGDVLADHPMPIIGRPLGATFIGMLFLAIATSLPEIVTGLAAVRIGNMDMALGNLFGSNMFNIFVVPMMTLTSFFAPEGRLIGGADFDAARIAVAGLLPVLLTGVVIGGISYRGRRKVLKRLGVDSALIALIYAGGMCLLIIES